MASWTPWDRSGTSSLLGQRVAAMRRRKWSICSSGISRRKDWVPGAVSMVLVTTTSVRGSEGPECGSQLRGEKLRLFPGGEVAAAVDFVEVDEVGVGPLGPAARRLILLAGEDGHGHRDRDALRVEEAALVLPVEARRRDARLRQPVERDVVEDLVTRQLARGTRRPVQRRDHCRGRLAVGVVVVEKPG